jgi:hypothetical protein
MVVNGSSSGSYGDASSRGRKSVCSMCDASSDNSRNGGSGNNSGKSTPCSFTEYSDSNLSEMENLNKKIRVLQTRMERHQRWVDRLNHPEVKGLFEKSDRDVNSLTPEQRLARRWYEVHCMYNYERFQEFIIIYGYTDAVDDQINRFRSSMKRAYDRIDMHNQRIQAILAEEQNAGASQSQNNSVNNNNNNNNN